MCFRDVDCKRRIWDIGVTDMHTRRTLYIGQDGRIDLVISSVQAQMGKLNEVRKREMRGVPDP